MDELEFLTTESAKTLSLMGIIKLEYMNRCIKLSFFKAIELVFIRKY